MFTIHCSIVDETNIFPLSKWCLFFFKSHNESRVIFQLYHAVVWLLEKKYMNGKKKKSLLKKLFKTSAWDVAAHSYLDNVKSSPSSGFNFNWFLIESIWMSTLVGFLLLTKFLLPLVGPIST